MIQLIAKHLKSSTLVWAIVDVGVANGDLDEATSSIDTRTELLIQEALLALMRGKTSFVIAHRLSTIKGADCIVVVNDGRAVETGTHAELIAKGGFYAELYNSQFFTGMAI